jgi:hypothetical protein
VRGQHAAGSDSIAILNVCNVPMQSTAHDQLDSMGLSLADWALLERVRKSDARTATSMMSPDANAVGSILLSSLRRRVDTLGLTPDAAIVAAGVCAQRFMRSFTPKSGVKPLNVPHPSRGQWPKNPDDSRLLEVRRLFSRYA